MPAAADTYYGGGTTTSNSTGIFTRANELKELARALKNDPDLIYEHVRNNMAMVWTYGLTKGGVGVSIDRSGTAFDQAHLMVELLREAGFTAAYKVGTITLTGAQFSDWTGITSATAACQLLSSGGIPGAVNGSTSATCAYGAASVTTIEIGHVWVDVTIAGVHYVFDPAYKPHTFKAGVNLATAAGFTTGQPLTSATSSMTTGTQSGVGYVRNVGSPAIAAYETALRTTVTTTSPRPGMDDLVGGQSINPATIPVGGLRQTTLPYTSSVLRTITGNVPDQYRTKLTVQLTKLRPDTSTPTVVNKLLYVDEIYGRRLIFDSNFDTTGASFTGALKLLDELGAGPSLASVSYADNPTFSKGTLSLVVDMPYASSSGAYMDTTFTRPVSYALPFTIVHGWGDVGRGLMDRWGQRKDTPMPTPDATCDVCQPSYHAWKGDGRRELEAASWLAQATRAAQIHANISKSIWAHHYSVGVVAADTTVYANGTGPIVYSVTDSFDRVDVETGYSLTNRAATALDRRAAVHAIADTIDALKGSTVSQIADLPDITSTSTMIEWGKGATKSVFQYNNTTDASQAATLVLAEGVTTTANSSTHAGTGEPSIGDPETQARRTALASVISSYATAGFVVTSPAESFLGPGQRGGGYQKISAGVYSHAQSRQRGGVVLATKYDGNGDPTEIARVVVTPDGAVTGGGGGAQIYHQAQYDPAMSADILKSRFVNGMPGDVSYPSPAMVKSGPAAMPHGLAAGLIWRGGDAPDTTYGANLHTRPQGPWTTNWHNGLMLGSSALEAMGETDARAAIAMLTAFVTAQDVYRASPSAQRDIAAAMANAYWLGRIRGNVATVSLGGSTRQFLKDNGTTLFSPGADSYATLSLSNVQRTAIAEHPSCLTSGVTYVPTRGWKPNASAATLTLANGDTQTFTVWSSDFLDGAGSPYCNRQQGLRLTNMLFGASQNINLTYAAPTPGYSVEVLSQVINTQGRKIVFSGGGLTGFTNGLTSGDLRQVSVSGTTTITHTDPASQQTKFDVSTLGTANYQRYLLDKIYAADNLMTPAVQNIYDSLGRLKQQKDELAYLGSRPAAQINLADGLRAEMINAAADSAIEYYDQAGRVIRSISPVGQITTSAYDGRGRVASVTAPEGDKQTFEYDDHNNQTKVTQIAKPGSPEAASNIVTEASYEQTTNTPTWTKDAKAAQTDYTLAYPGRIGTITSPNPKPGVDTRPVAEISYTSYLQRSRVEDWFGVMADAYYNADGSLSSSVIGNQTTTYTNNAQGLPTSINGPRTDVSDIWTVEYDAVNRETLRVAPAVSPHPSLAMRTTYDAVGRVTVIEQGTYTGSTFTSLQTTTMVYDAVGNKIRVTDPAGLTQYSYDAANRLVCTAVRMNPAVYGSLPADACTGSTVGPQGPDRITRNTYDAAGRVTQVDLGVGTATVVPYQRNTYTQNGKAATLTDANGNKSAFAYDGFDRLKRLYFPDGVRGSGIASATDYEEYGYDVNGNRTSIRKRNGQSISYTFDPLNRVTLKDLPGGTASDIAYSYLPGGGPLQQASNALNATATVTYGYDAFGRVNSDDIYGSAQGATTVQYDTAGNRTRVTVGGLAAIYTYDAQNRLTKIETSLSGGAASTLQSYTYDSLGRRASVVRPSGADTTYTYDVASRLASLAHTGVPSTTSTSQTFTYNAANQALTGTQSNSLYAWSGQPVTTKNSTHDGLNRDAAIAVAAGYDANGNLTADGTRTFTYDLENRLIEVSGGTSDLALSYDAMGRLYKTVADGISTTTFSYDGVRLVSEASQSGGSYYVHGLGTDEPVASYSASSWRYLHADRQGSIIGTSTSAGVITPYAYGPYGEPQTWAGSRFRYTGQIMLPEAQLYHYKARVYDPSMGRFLQTDPIGYDDGLNMYAYVGGDPLNATDPSGESVFVSEEIAPGPAGCASYSQRMYITACQSKHQLTKKQLTTVRRSGTFGLSEFFGQNPDPSCPKWNIARSFKDNDGVSQKFPLMKKGTNLTFRGFGAAAAIGVGVTAMLGTYEYTAQNGQTITGDFTSEGFGVGLGAGMHFDFIGQSRSLDGFFGNGVSLHAEAAFVSVTASVSDDQTESIGGGVGIILMPITITTTNPEGAPKVAADSPPPCGK